MKHLLFLMALWAITMSVRAQRDVTKFLGIPVDGLKSEMIQKLKSKGYVYHQSDDYFTGEFNGHNVQLRIVTNNNKVWRIMLNDVINVDESSIKIRFNNLVRQFEMNNKYMAAGFTDYTISDDDDISYEMSVHSKRYEAAFYQLPNEADSLLFRKNLREKLLTKYTEEQLADTTEIIQRSIRMDALDFSYDLYRKKSVWFMISEFYGKYYLIMYYDNEWNHSDGEDL